MTEPFPQKPQLALFQPEGREYLCLRALMSLCYPERVGSDLLNQQFDY